MALKIQRRRIHFSSKFFAAAAFFRSSLLIITTCSSLSTFDHMTAQLCAYFRKDLAHHFQCRKTLLHYPNEITFSGFKGGAYWRTFGCSIGLGPQNQKIKLHITSPLETFPVFLCTKASTGRVTLGS